VSVHPIEIYSDERLTEFEPENRLTPAPRARCLAAGSIQSGPASPLAQPCP
jgi:hypothetical protein